MRSAENIWDNFSSQSYKELPSVGTITVHDPMTGQARAYPMPAGGRGYTRPASLISLWSTAPFLLNNSVGKLDPQAYGDYIELSPSPSVDARMRSFQDSIEQMLWPEKRDKDLLLGDKVPGRIDRTTEMSHLRVPAGYLPDSVRVLLRTLGPLAAEIAAADGGIEIGPIPKGTPVNLLANLNLLPEEKSQDELPAHIKKVIELLIDVKRAWKALPGEPTDQEAAQVLGRLVEPLLELSKCRDFVVNRGHYFGTGYFRNEPVISDQDQRALIEAKEEPALSDQDKRALIEFLKTF